MRVALWMGGRSGEHAISLASGREVAAALEVLGHEQLEVIIERDGAARWGADGRGTFAKALAAVEDWGPDVAFIAMHGEDGEDGRVQAALELIGVPYQGSGVQASAIGLDKVRTKEIFRAAGLPVAPDMVVTRGDDVDAHGIVGRLGLPVMLKTEASGSSVGVERVEDEKTLGERLGALLATTPRVLLEPVLTGREFTGAVLELGGVPTALPIVEIKPVSARFFDYEAKYTPGATDEICPAPIDDALRDRLQALALDAHRALRCRGYSRTDIMLDADGAPRLLETNTLPGLTRESLLPRAARAHGLAFHELVAALLASASGKARSARVGAGEAPQATPSP